MSEKLYKERNRESQKKIKMQKNYQILLLNSYLTFIINTELALFLSMLRQNLPTYK